MAKAAQHVVSDREKSTARVVRTARRYAASTARELRKLLDPVLAEGEEMPDLVGLQELMARVLERHMRLLVTADDVLTELESQDAVLRARRDASVDRVYRQVGDLRNLVAGRLDRKIARIFLPLKGETSRDPRVLLRQADLAVERLRDFTESPQTAAFCDAERELHAAPLAEQADALRRHDARARHSAKGLDLARLDRRRALEEFNQVFIKIAQWFEITYRVIAREDLADAVRPSKQYPGRTVAEIRERPGPTAEAEPEPAAPSLPFEPLRHIARALGFGVSSEEDRRAAGGGH